MPAINWTSSCMKTKGQRDNRREYRVSEEKLEWIYMELRFDELFMFFFLLRRATMDDFFGLVRIHACRSSFTKRGFQDPRMS